MFKIKAETKDRIKDKALLVIFIVMTIAGIFMFYNTFHDNSIPKNELVPKRMISLTIAYFFGMGGALFYVLKKDAGKIDQQISHHLNTIIVKGSSRKNTALFFSSTGFVMMGYILIAYPDYFEEGNHFVKIGIGVVSVVFFGLALVLAFVRFFRNGSQIVINEKGISVNAQIRAFTYLWEDVDAFETLEIKSTKMIGIMLSETGSKKRKQNALIKKINRAVSGDTRNMESITADVFDIGHVQLLDLLRAKLKAYKTKKEPN
jgi:hypothetical protein